MKTLAPNTVPTKYWQLLRSGRVQCDVCPRFCQLLEGQQGLCFVRARQNDQIVLTTYGRSSGFCVDPIEKKPLNHFLPGSPVLSFGTAGCNLSCKFCQNWDISKSREQDTLAASASPLEIAAAALDTGCRSIAFTYNDPVVFMEYAIDVAKEARRQRIHTVAVSAGYICAEPRAEFFKHIDAAQIDLKSFSDVFYQKLCAGRLEPVLDTLLYLKHETNVWLEITTLLIPGENDSPEELEALSSWVCSELGPEVPLHFSAFHPDYKMLDTPSTSALSLKKAREIALQSGLHYVYTGNVHDPEGDSTYCNACSAKIIGRDWYLITDYNLDDEGRCQKCGTACHGVFSGPAGTWGRKRKSVSIK